MFKFLHTADIHLDSPLLRLEQYDGAPVEEFRSATRRAFDRVIDLAISEQVRFILISGDLYDGDCRDFQTAIHFRQKMELLQQHGIGVFIIQGNHDAQSNITKAFRLQLPDNVHLFPTNRPGSVLIDDLRVAIHGQGFANRAVEEDLSVNYPDAVVGYYNIGLLHTSCGAYQAHDRYAPSTLKGLSSQDYDYWALGHIHKRETLAGPRPQIVYPGNVQGRHIGETGEKGCLIVTVDGNKTSLRFHATDVLRWARCVVDATELDSAIDLPTVVTQAFDQLLKESGGRPLAIRVIVQGATAIHREIVRQSDHWDREIRIAALDQFDSTVWVEKIKFDTRSKLERPAVADNGSALADLVTAVNNFDNLDYLLSELNDDIKRLDKTVPSDPRLKQERTDFHDRSTLSNVVRQAREFLIGRLLESKEDGS